jgi:hypothetical protein
MLCCQWIAHVLDDDTQQPVTAFSILPLNRSESNTLAGEHQLPYTLYHIRIPMVLENLLACDASIQLAEKPTKSKEKGLEGSTSVDWADIPRGGEYQASGVSLKEGDDHTFLVVTLPSLGLKSEPLDIHTERFKPKGNHISI